MSNKRGSNYDGVISILSFTYSHIFHMQIHSLLLAIRLQVFDCRYVTTTSGMFEALCNHIKYSTNKGNIR